MRERLVYPNDRRDVRGLEPARQIRDRFHVERSVFVVDRAVIETGRLDDPGNAARGELLEPGAQRRPSFAHRPPYAVFFHGSFQASFILGGLARFCIISVRDNPGLSWAISGSFAANPTLSSSDPGARQGSAAGTAPCDVEGSPIDALGIACHPLAR